jgi:hypothetical protein
VEEGHSHSHKDEAQAVVMKKKVNGAHPVQGDTQNIGGRPELGRDRAISPMV